MNVASLVDVTLFEFFYKEAAINTADTERYKYHLDPEALQLAGSKFVSDYLSIDPESFHGRGWEVQVSIVINLLVRACASFPIIKYDNPTLTESLNSHGELTHEYELIPAWCVKKQMR